MEEPGSKLLRHKLVLVGTANGMADLLKSTISKNEPDISNFCELGCDGTFVNTEWKRGAVAQLEKYFQATFQWMIYLFHSELYLWHLLQSLDGLTAGPNSYSGVVVKQLKNFEKMIIISFVALEFNLLEMNVELVRYRERSFS